MNTCETCQAKLLHFVYGLLEADEQKEVLAHISECGQCRSALERAEEQQKLMSVAAKTEFPGIRFTPPGPQASEPTRIMPRPARPKPWGRWAIAASVLLLLVGGGAFGIVGWNDRQNQLDSAKNQFAQSQKAFNQGQNDNQRNAERVNKDLSAIGDEIRRLEEDWNKEANQERIIQEKKTQVKIKGARSFQAGARNTYQVEMGPMNAPMGKGPLNIEVVDPVSKKVLFAQEIPNGGVANVDLPPNLPVRDGVQLVMEIKGKTDKGETIQVTEQMPLVASLFMTHLVTDRPMYRPGETVRFRSLTLERFSLKPAQEDFQIQFRITAPNDGEIFKANGPAQVTLEKGKEPIKGPDGKVIRGLAAGEFAIPAELPGGEYTLHVSDAGNRFPAEQRKFLVNKYQAPRLNKEIVFNRKSYGPGDMVEANCKVTRVEGGVAVAGQLAQATWQVDGMRNQINLPTDQNGKVAFRFTLPKSIDKGEGSLSVQFTDGGNNETIVRPIPIITKKLLADFYPEGGDLVAGVPNRVYFQVRTPIGKPAELTGRIVDQAGNVLAKVQTLSDDLEPGVNQGMGVFTFTPQPGKNYELKIDSPIGIESRHELPAVKADGVVLNIPKGVVEDKIDVVLHNTGKDRQLLVGAYCRGRLVDNSDLVAVKDGAARKVKLVTAPGVSGVYRITVFENLQAKGEGKLVPIAERLIYRRPVERLNFDIVTDKQEYAPGEPVKVTIRAKNEKTKVTPTIALISVVDLSIIKLADEKTARTMPAHFYLTTEIQKPEDLEYADFLVSDHAKAAAALDLLLGTQGWRRFAEQEPGEFLKRNPEAGRRLLAASGQDVQQTNTAEQLVLAKVARKFEPKMVELVKTEKAKEEEQARVVAKDQQDRGALLAQQQQAQMRINDTALALENFKRWFSRVSLAVVVLGLLLIGVGALIIGLRRLSSDGTWATPYLVTGACVLFVLFLGSLGGTFYLMQHGPEHERVMEAAARKQAAPNMGGGGGDVPPANVAPDMQVVEEMQKMNKFADGKFEKGKRFGPMPKKMEDPQDIAIGLKDADKNKAGDDKLWQKAEKQAMIAIAPGQGPAGFKGAGGIAADQMMPGGMMQPGFPGRLEQQDRNLRRKALLALSEAFVVRQYAHQHQTSADNVRRDFTETLYWHPVLVMPDGSGEFRFDLSDATTRFQVLAMGHSLDGRLGTGTLDFASKLPYSIEPKVPMEVTNTDKVTIPLTIANDSRQNQNVEIDVEAKGLATVGNSKDQFLIDGGKRMRRLFQFEPSILEGKAILNFTGKFGGFTDRIERTFQVVPEGFPVVKSQSDMLEGVARHEIVLPESWVKGTLQVQVQAFPSTLADLQKGLESLLREPGGCFEQSSSSNYPNVLILNYLKESESSKPEVEKRARQLLASGYQQLTSFECIDPSARTKKEGYEWFGQTAPPHEALTAYGLLQFRDMARVLPVDEEMVNRTKKYLLGQRDGKGGFKRNQRALDSFGRAPDDITNAYIVWAITDAGKDDVEQELKVLTAKAKDSKDPYFLALVGNSLINRSKTAEGLEVLKKLMGLQQADGHLQGTSTSITGSQGRDLQIETTALSILAWLKANRPEFNDSVQKAIKWMGQQRGGYGGFGSTQSTILALKALIEHTRTNKRPANAGELKLFVGDQEQPVAVQAFAAGSLEPLIVKLPDDKVLRPGKNKLRVEITGNNAFPHTLSWSYRTLKPANPENAPVQLVTKLDRSTAKEGDTVKLKAVVENKSDKGQGMAVAILGLPGGMSLPEDFAQLKEMVRLRDNGTKPGVISFWELRGRELVLYWRDLAPNQKIEVNIDLVCRIPGDYRGPASRAYLYYNSDLKHWVDPVAMTIEPKE